MDKTLIQFHPEVREALESHCPVVALESTLITHGLPYPVNLEVAGGLEKAVRKAGAVPATIAVLQGQITVGLTPLNWPIWPRLKTSANAAGGTCPLCWPRKAMGPPLWRAP